ncbi:MAG TPA: alkene reductase [Gemmatimonadales bacterium]|nr:alkene reductase [Gemmatimonadales bacterium]
MTDIAPLLTPTTLGGIPLANRVVMAPMTRNRADDRGVPTPAMTTYYRQRASAGLIVAEMTQISPSAQGYILTPGIHNEAQVAAWREVTEAVHAEGGRIVLQLGHTGRIAHPDITGVQPVAPSAIAAEGLTFTQNGQVPFVEPRALTLEEIPGIVAQFRLAANFAREAGFDGVELHAANGYLLDQFLRSGTNKRDDQYGGSATNRARLLLEVVSAAIEVWGPGRVGVRLSPFNPYNTMSDADPFTTFPTVAALLALQPLAYLHVTYGGGSPEDRARMAPLMRSAFTGALIVNAGYTAESGAEVIAAGEAEAVAYGVPFIANPDLVERFAQRADLSAADASTFYMGGEKGYTDYAVMAGAVAE